MDKWADYGISKVQYNQQRNHIVKVEVREDNGDSFGSAIERLRSQVVSAIESGKTFVTILKGSDGKWKKGQAVHVVVINRNKYIRTDQNQRESDNLGNLPEF